MSLDPNQVDAVKAEVKELLSRLQSLGVRVNAQDVDTWFKNITNLIGSLTAAVAALGALLIGIATLFGQKTTHKELEGIHEKADVVIKQNEFVEKRAIDAAVAIEETASKVDETKKAVEKATGTVPAPAATNGGPPKIKGEP